MARTYRPFQILFLTTLLTLLPSAVVMMTSFTRYIISFSFLRSAMGLQQNPPNMVLVGIALFLRCLPCLRSSVRSDHRIRAIYCGGDCQEEFLQRAEKPLKEFMAGQVEKLAQALLRSGKDWIRRLRHRPRAAAAGFGSGLYDK